MGVWWDRNRVVHRLPEHPVLVKKLVQFHHLLLQLVLEIRLFGLEAGDLTLKLHLRRQSDRLQLAHHILEGSLDRAYLLDEAWLKRRLLHLLRDRAASRQRKSKILLVRRWRGDKGKFGASRVSLNQRE